MATSAVLAKAFLLITKKAKAALAGTGAVTSYRLCHVPFTASGNVPALK
jgi:hypothetical protein